MPSLPRTVLLSVGRHAAQRGHTLPEALVAIAVIGILCTWMIPRLDRVTARARLESAAAEVATAMVRARETARLRGHRVGLKFFPSPGRETTYALFADGDFDGVRTQDIERGIDPMIAPPHPLQGLGADIRFGIPRDRNGRAPRRIGSRRRMDRLDDPIRFNRSDIASFSRGGTATPGTVYLTDGSRVVAVRVLNRSGKVAVLRYDFDEEIWR